MVASRENFFLLDELLGEQQRLDTPVSRFTAAYTAAERHAPGFRHTSLIPLSRPGPGEQYAFEVRLDACSGCKSCVAACHSLNGLDENETWRDVGLIVGVRDGHAYQQTVTTACHHCADPGCLNGCPVLAYEKDPLTGIVRHLDDQCIGCQYCILKCPYDAPKYNARLGIVRKCDMCHERLADGEPPACVQACPTHAISIVTVPVGPDFGISDQKSDFLPAAPDPSYTKPTTHYVSQHGVPANVTAADALALTPQPPHWPLAIMLTLMPIAVGFSVAAAAGDVTYYVTSPANGTLASAAWLTGVAGLAASILHLGRPLRAWRIFLGWRRSWLSREALVFGAWLAASTASLAAPQLRIAAALLGVAGLGCSAMIYADTRRIHWRLAETAPRFFGTVLITFLAAFSPPLAGLALLVKLVWEARALTGQSVATLLMKGPLRSRLILRFGFGLVASLVLASGVFVGGLFLAAAGELLERHLYFRAVDAPRMPGLPGMAEPSATAEPPSGSLLAARPSAPWAQPDGAVPEPLRS